jgi:hypothetical protein
MSKPYCRTFYTFKCDKKILGTTGVDDIKDYGVPFSAIIVLNGRLSFMALSYKLLKEEIYSNYHTLA